MSVPLVGRVREWLETVPDYFGMPATAVRELRDGLSVVERLVLFLYADFEQRNLTNPSLDRIAKGIGRRRRQAIRVVEALRDDLRLLTIVRAAGQHHANGYRVTIPGVTVDDTAGGRAEVTREAPSSGIGPSSGDIVASPKRRERSERRRGAGSDEPAARDRSRPLYPTVKPSTS